MVARILASGLSVAECRVLWRSLSCTVVAVRLHPDRHRFAVQTPTTLLSDPQGLRPQDPTRTAFTLATPERLALLAPPGELRDEQAPKPLAGQLVHDLFQFVPPFIRQRNREAA